ncbi:MAG: hypothetical protein ACLFS7_10815 [Desulfosudaceae bacterium]
MDFEAILARLNLHAVLPNLEELVGLDARAAEISGSRDICIRFVVRQGPRAFVRFQQGNCQVGTGDPPGSDVTLFFTSCRHLNRMFAGQANPVPLKGFTRIGFLTGPFQELTRRLEYYLDPAQGDLADAGYEKINTRLSLFTAARAIPVLADGDAAVQAVTSGMPAGSIVLKVLPEGPAVSLTFGGAGIVMNKGEVDQPSACMYFKDIHTAGALLNQQLNPFAAIALGDVMIRGQLPLIDAMDLILDRVPHYLAA